jgi:aldehyde dehydrogenase (NAD+)
LCVCLAACTCRSRPKIKALKSTLKKFFADSDHMARIVNARHFQRLSDLLKDKSVAASVLHGGTLDAKNL